MSKFKFYILSLFLVITTVNCIGGQKFCWEGDNRPNQEGCPDLGQCCLFTREGEGNYQTWACFDPEEKKDTMQEGIFIDSRTQVEWTWTCFNNVTIKTVRNFYKKGEFINFNDVLGLTEKLPGENPKYLGGSLNERLQCGETKDIMTPFSENLYDEFGLEYVEFYTKHNHIYNDECVKLRIFVDEGNYFEIQKYIDIKDNKKIQCKKDKMEACLTNLQDKIAIAFGVIEIREMNPDKKTCGDLISHMTCSQGWYQGYNMYGYGNGLCRYLSSTSGELTWAEAGLPYGRTIDARNYKQYGYEKCSYALCGEDDPQQCVKQDLVNDITGAWYSELSSTRVLLNFSIAVALSTILASF